MAYEAIITPIVNIREHPNADRLNLGTAAGHQVIISKDIEEGTLGILFPPDGQLTHEMCHENNLYRHTQHNKDSEANGGFFDDNRRVRAQKLRSAISEGFWTQLEVLNWTGVDCSSLKQGDLVQELNGHLICQKYYTKATRMAKAAGKGKGKGKKAEPKEKYSQFKEHFDTQKLRMMIEFIPKGAILSITEKCHGTSGRTGYLPAERKLGRFKQWWNKRYSSVRFVESEYKYVSGSRRVVLSNNKSKQQPQGLRDFVHEQIKNAGLNKGETVYYEIVGFDEKGGSIMGAHGPQDKALKKLYGERMVYSYGCNEADVIAGGGYRVLVYRMTVTTPDGRRAEMPWHQMKVRCQELGLEAVPQLKEPFVYDGNPDKLMDLCEKLSQGHSTLDDKHIKEGVVVRVEAPGVDTHYKYKGFHFCELEGIQKNNDNYVDPEEIA